MSQIMSVKQLKKKLYLRYKNVLTSLVVVCVIIFSWMVDFVDISFENLDIAYTEMKSFLMKIGEVDINNMPKKQYILAFKIRYLVIISFYLIGFVITFVITNWKFFLYTILVYIFVKCLLTDFFTKHFKFNKSWNINYKDIWRRKKSIFSFIVKSWLVMLPIRFLIRGSIIALFHFNNNFISDIFIILLALPFYYYFFNILRKYLQARLQGMQRRDAFMIVKPAFLSFTINSFWRGKHSLGLENDYYLFNHYVIKQMNLYNIIYIIFTVWIIKNYFYYCLIFMIIIFVIIMEIVLYNFFTVGSAQQAARQQGKVLLASPPILTYTLASIMYNLGAYLSWSAMLGHNEPEKFNYNVFDDTEEYGPCSIKQVAASKFNTYKQVNPSVECFNWIHDNAAEDVNISQWPRENDLAMAQIVKSPILRMVHAQWHVAEKQHEFKRDVGSLTYEPLIAFKNDRFIGSVARMKNTLVINLLETNRPLPKKHFWPTHYVQDESLRHIKSELEPVRWAMRFFEEKYGILIPLKDEIHNIITLTETKPFGTDPTLAKFLRPYYLFSDLSTLYTSAEQYFLSRKQDNWGPDPDELSKYGKIIVLKHNAINLTRSEQFIKENDDRLKELYNEYLEIRLKRFRSKFPNLDINYEDVEPNFNSERGFMFKKCTSPDIKSLFFFKQDELPIFFSFKKSTLIDMSWTRRRLIDKIEKLEPHVSYNAICANNISVELLSVENTTGFSTIADSPEVYSICKIDHYKEGSLYITDKIGVPVQTFNVLDKKDGKVLEKFLKHPLN
uniref:Uncharacterized protein n=1 Tax=Hirsutella thompsonii TaxID=42368 RepID=A0A3G2ZNE8_HIRTH|nr:hypothetical protein [Hirsutella thompsonii]AYP41263.1 hypothetical protein [Hirsutella thompsonii]